MSRLRYVRREELDPGGQEVWDRTVESRGHSLINEQGGLIGPFNAIVQAPVIGGRVAELGRVLRFETSIERRLLEVAIITVGAHWKAEFEWWAHARLAREHGVPEKVVAAIGRGGDPPFESEDERAIYTTVRQLVATGRVDDVAYLAARDLLGDEGLVELVALCGYYTLVSFVLNAFAVPLPPDVSPTWPDASCS
jgi:4-carboxymuconolactone decarboxylase